MMGNNNHRQINRFPYFIERGAATQAGDLPGFGINGKNLALKSSLNEVIQDRKSHGFRPSRCANHRNRLRLEQGLQILYCTLRPSDFIIHREPLHSSIPPLRADDHIILSKIDQAPVEHFPAFPGRLFFGGVDSSHGNRIFPRLL